MCWLFFFLSTFTNGTFFSVLSIKRKQWAFSYIPESWCQLYPRSVSLRLTWQNFTGNDENASCGNIKSFKKENLWSTGYLKWFKQSIGNFSLSISNSLIRHSLIKSISLEGLTSYMLNITLFSSICQSVSFGKRGLYSQEEDKNCTKNPWSFVSTVPGVWRKPTG